VKETVRVCAYSQCGKEFTSASRKVQTCSTLCGYAHRREAYHAEKAARAGLAPARTLAPAPALVAAVTEGETGPDPHPGVTKEDAVLALEARNAELQEENYRVLRELDRTRKKTAAVVDAVKESVFSAARELVLNPPAAIIHEPSGTGSPQVAVLLASDWQLGKVTSSYNSEVCEERVRALGRKVIDLARIQAKAHPVRECRVYLGGDIVEGEGIFPTQAHVVDSGLYRQLVVYGIRILANLFMDLIGHFDKVHVVGVPGNHGDMRFGVGSTDSETNADRILYRAAEIALLGTRDHPTPLAESGRLTFNIPDGPGERSFYAVDHVGKWGFLITHGDQIRGFAGFPFYGAAKKAWGWIDSIPEPWDTLMIGHWHTPTSLTLNHRQVRVNGSLESHNSYAQEFCAAVGEPTQWLGFVHPERGITAEYWVHVGEPASSFTRAQALVSSRDVQ
jgi:hypothetical protein